MSSPNRRLFFDIETSLCVVYSWRIGRKITLNSENIKEPSTIICISWMWEGNQNVRSLTWDRRQNPKKMLDEFVTIMHSADEIVSHNGDRFDVPWVRTQCLLNDIPMCPDFVSIDTLKGCRSKFRFNSNRLDSVAQDLGIGKKRDTGGLGLWIRVMEGDPIALQKMVEYNKHDVRLLVGVFERLNPYLSSKTHRGRYTSDCPECGSPKTWVKSRRVSAKGHKSIQIQCQDCGKYNMIAASRQNKQI